MAWKVTMSDYNADWALVGHHFHPRPHAGYINREDLLAFFGKLDLSGIELNHGYWEDYDNARLRRLADQSGVKVVTYVAFSDLAQSSQQRAKALDEVFALLDRTRELGASRLFLVPATFKREFDSGQQISWLVEGLRQAAERAASLGMTIVSENIDFPPSRPLMGRGSQCRDICSAVDSVAFRLIFDMAAPIFVGEDSLATLETMAPFMAHVHLKNFRRLNPNETRERYLDTGDGERMTGVTLDAGILKVKPVLDRLTQLNYDGFVQIEYQGEDDPRAALQHNLKYVRSLEKDSAVPARKGVA